MRSAGETRILCCGLVCLDQVFIVKTFPKEDTDQRSQQKYKVRGGNASNNCTVLSILGFKPVFLGSLAGDAMETDFLLESFHKSGINVEEACPRHFGYGSPTAAILLSSQTGSRTIIAHNPGLPELSLDDFKCVRDLERFSWVHVEGRNKTECLKILKYLGDQNKVRFSVEVEKVGRGLEEFIPFADWVFVSKEVSEHHGCTNMEQSIRYFYKQLKVGGGIVVPWGDRGASCALRKDESSEPEIYSFPAYPPPGGVVDTIGAGDTFLATVVGCLARGMDFRKAVDTGCKVAGRKVGIIGFEGLRDNVEDIFED